MLTFYWCCKSYKICFGYNEIKKPDGERWITLKQKLEVPRHKYGRGHKPEFITIYGVGGTFRLEA